MQLFLPAVVAAAVLATATAIDNGLGVSPPMGWRSWNAYHHAVNQSIMERSIDAMVARTRNVSGVPTSLLDLGYNNCGLDDNWQACGTGVGGSFHDDKGVPLINTDTFPSMRNMTDYGHQRGMRVGWYHNNCICAEHNFPSDLIDAHYAGDVTAIAGYGYDGVKLDGCGEFMNLTYWADLLNATGRPILIENCHWGDTLPTVDWCPFNFYRTSGDIQANWASMMSNLHTTIKFQDWKQPLSRPGCWAYPDMLEVGNLASFEEDRTHFGAWAIVSSPLILGFDLQDQAKFDRVWPIISNKEAIAVNQQWAGHPGMLVTTLSPEGSKLYPWAEECGSDSSQKGWTYDPASMTVEYAGYCLDGSSSSQLALTACTNSAEQAFDYHAGAELKFGDSCVDNYDFSGPVVQIYGCNNGKNQLFTISDGYVKDAENLCWSVKNSSPAGSNVEVWAKPQPNNAMAVLFINDMASTASNITLDLSLLNITADVHVRAGQADRSDDILMPPSQIINCVL
ncbi:uncharacterized protein MONBRDRAFT_31543 [Monosiga brevicollis MX1]|uniref:Alpha-galactosidase n=1 Tax=Monosiga brevicollis TaxID=81824 RepID=A9UTV2_MONBE|nr:uncharacterized protein MONBRDRAFT_31543 [Monosiga brevicollis MX1]EDQ91557.1 predicted protein [Monosiga brevicollis MX1]|eukprot:XP_001743979.1 hypothetical protein [Monosiga brevicollis MX1]